ncbi:MAG: hypothetical protein Q7K43_06765 [Candidatus Woesearchaeota archaeon]|nr:hypothetical protein [Candidatus Woesearchaeota archaeon]
MSYESSDYELVPEKEIVELKDELRRIKELDVQPANKFGVGITELSVKIDRLIAIFEDAFHELRLEQGGLSFQDKMKPLVERIDKILEQNAQIAEAMVALNDGMNEVKQKMDGGIPRPMSQMPIQQPQPVYRPASQFSQQPLPLRAPQPLPGMLPPLGPMPPPPPPPRKGMFSGY